MAGLGGWCGLRCRAGADHSRGTGSELGCDVGAGAGGVRRRDRARGSSVLWIVVFDTNVLISARLSTNGNPAACLALARIGVIRSVTCEEILREFREKLLEKFGYTEQRAEEATNEVR